MATRFEEVQIERVRANSANIREDLGDLERLSAEVKTIGIKQPLVVYPHPVLEGDFVIQDGHRRRQAAINAGLSTVPVVVVDAPLRGELDDVETMLTTGRNHAALSKLDEAKGFQRLLDLGLNESTIGKKFKQPKSEIVAKARVKRSAVEVQEAYGVGRLGLDDVKKLQELEDAGQTGLYERVVETIANGDKRYTLDLERTIARAEQDVRKAELKARMDAAGAPSAPQDASWSSKWDRMPDAEGEELTDEEHVAAGHYWLAKGYDTVEVVWFAPLAVARPEISEAEKEEKKQLKALSAELSISYQVRSMAVTKSIASKANDAYATDHELLCELLLHDVLNLDDDSLGDITGIHCPDGLVAYTEAHSEWKERVRAAVTKFSWGQLARAATYKRWRDTDRQLRFAKNFDRTVYDWANRRTWINTVQSHFGYELDQAEQDVIELFKAKGGTYSSRELTEGTNRRVEEDVTIIRDGAEVSE